MIIVASLVEQGCMVFTYPAVYSFFNLTCIPGLQLNSFGFF